MFDVYNCTALYSKYKQSYAPYQLALVTHLSEMDASYGRLERLVDHLHCMLAAIQSSRTLAHS